MRRVWRRSGVDQGRGGSRLRQEPGSALWVRFQVISVRTALGRREMNRFQSNFGFIFLCPLIGQLNSAQ